MTTRFYSALLKQGEQMNASVFSDWKYSVSTQFQKHLYRKGKTKTFSYDACDIGQAFVLESTLDSSFYYMTSLQSGVRSGDCVQIYYPDKIITYRIQEIEYYSEPSDMWIAILLKIGVDQSNTN